MAPHRKKVCRVAAVAAVPLGIAAAFAFLAPVAGAATAAPANRAAVVRLTAASLPHPLTNRPPTRLLAYRWAERQRGHPYMYGGTGPGYDCSGLVMMAYRHAGIRLPRTTSGMLASSKLVRVYHPRMGDLAFFGSGHVELFRKWGFTFGAHDWELPVGLIHYGWSWKPTAFYRVR